LSKLQTNYIGCISGHRLIKTACQGGEMLISAASNKHISPVTLYHRLTLFPQFVLWKLLSHGIKLTYFWYSNEWE